MRIPLTRIDRGHGAPPAAQPPLHVVTRNAGQGVPHSTADPFAEDARTAIIAVLWSPLAAVCTFALRFKATDDIIGRISGG
jgi:hypothetical protein